MKTNHTQSLHKNIIKLKKQVYMPLKIMYNFKKATNKTFRSTVNVLILPSTGNSTPLKRALVMDLA